MLDVEQIRNRYLRFFERNGHTVIPSARLIPENDSTTLFNSAGMQPLVPFLLGAPHPSGTRLVNSQKCFRAEDIAEVGDNRHTTFFEMLGNWSLGDYFKNEQLPWFFKFLVEEIGLSPERIYVTAFIGDEKNKLPRDDESALLWQKLFAQYGIEATVVAIGSEKAGGEKGMQGGRIFLYDGKKNWWSRSGPPDAMPAGEPGGPDSEVFYDFGTPHDQTFGKECHPNCDCGRFLEIGNSVFMEYKKEPGGSFSKLPKQNVDFGGGLERIAAATNNNADIFLTDVLRHVIETVERITKTSYTTCTPSERAAMRIAADHFRAALFMAADGVLPSNKERGYIMRRLLRRALFKLHRIGASLNINFIEAIISSLVSDYESYYPEVADVRQNIINIIGDEAQKFFTTLETGERLLQKESLTSLTPELAFTLFTAHGYPVELAKEIVADRGIPCAPNFDHAFTTLMEQHRSTSRAGIEQKFKGGLADTSEKTIQYHTATHLLHKALREVLGNHVMQKGSNITPDRLRFDFTHGSKMTDEEKARVEAFVNNAIKAALPVHHVVLPKKEAEESGALHFFGEKYGEQVSVYYVGEQLENALSKEFCGGPHVANTQELNGTFKITKEESVSAGVRRIKAILV